MTGVVALVGAECSGKSTLAQALGEALPARVVPEYLRTFVQQNGRAPTAVEQRAVMTAQIRAERIAARQSAAGGDRWVVSEAGALMTAVYSLLYYGDESLVLPALEHHRTSCAATVWCDIDLPWVADPGQRDGPQFRAEGHRIIGRIVAEHSLAVLRATGSAGHRRDAILTALEGGR